MKRILSLLALLLYIFPVAYGQEAGGGLWNGSVSLDMGTNFKEGMSSRKFSNSSGNLNAWGSYRSDKFSIRMDLSVLPGFTATTVNGQTVNVKDTEAPQLNYDISQKEKTVFTETAGVQTEYRPDPQNTFNFSVRQTLDKQKPDKVVISINNILSMNGKEFEGMRTKCSFDIEEVNQSISGWNADAKWNHRFDKAGREIVFGAGWGLTRNDKASNWQIVPATDVFGSDETSGQETSGGGLPDKVYRITPLYTNNSLNATVCYRDADIFEQKSLNLELGVDLNAGFDRDELSAANLVNEVWVDSLEYRENFNYFSMSVVPRAKLSYSPGKFSFNLQLTPDFYINRLNSERKIGNFNFNKVYLLPDFQANWTPSTMHKLNLSYRQELNRPTYEQICWFQRAGSYANELQRGNPDLQPAGNGKLSLAYTFHSGFFTGTLEGMTTFKWNNIEKVFNTEEELRIYTWINSGHSTDSSIKLSLRADLKNFYATLSGYYNYFIGYDDAGDATRSSDWGIDCDATLKIKGGWIFNVKGRYQSKIIRTYSSITEYIGCDARVTKDFKRFSVFLQGKDLFDRPIEIVSYSEDHTYARIEEITYNRRIFSIGASFKF